MRASLQVEIDALGLSERVRLLGNIAADDLGAYYTLADVFCLPSVARSEAFGVVLLEAMAHGKPIVATRIPGSGVSWVNADGATGLNVEPGNPAELARALLQVLGDTGKALEYGRQGRARFQSLFTSDIMVRQVLDIYSSLAPAARSGG